MSRLTIVARGLGCILLSILCALSLVAHDVHEPLLLGAIHPSISPDGESIAFSHQGAIWRIARRGGVATRLTHTAGFDCSPVWSPDGKRIALVRGRGTTFGPIVLIDALDGHVIELPNSPEAKSKLRFAPDGNRLLGLFRDEGGERSLCWLDLKSGRLGPRLHPDQRGLVFDLSHQGSRIALATTLDVDGEQGGNNGPQCDVWTMPAEGGPPEKLFEFPGRLYDLTWNADGRSLCVVSNVGGAHNDLWHVPLRHPLKRAEKITFGQADEDSPSCDSDGRYLLFTDNRRGPTELVVRDLPTSHDAVVTVSGWDFGTPTGKLSIAIRDADTRDPTTARVSIRRHRGKYHAPADAIYRLLRGNLHFYCRGTTSMEVPAGPYSITIARGPEYPVVHHDVNVPADGTVDQKFTLQRWTNQRARGWYSGESHIHANYGYGHWYNSPSTMLAQSAGEDLIVSNFMVANSEADGVFDREFFRGRPDPLSSNDTILYWNQEFRSTIWGHLTLLDLEHLVEPIFTGFARTTHPHDHPTNADIADATHDQGGHVNYTHPAQNVKDPYLSAYSAKALPMDVALGKVDSIDIMGSNHEANLSIWYRLLNCGFRIPASAGTDCFLNRIQSRLPGQVRVYVNVEGEFSYEGWIKSLRAGRTFVTDGPMFDFTVDGQMAGSTIKLEEPGSITVQGTIRSHYPLNRVEIVSGGVVVQEVDIGSSSRDVIIEAEVPVDASGWIALRAAGPSHPDQPTSRLFGHTSPVYVEVAGRPLDPTEDAAYFVQWIDRLHTDIRRRNRVPSRHVVQVESQIAEALAVFRELADSGE